MVKRVHELLTALVLVIGEHIVQSGLPCVQLHFKAFAIMFHGSLTLFISCTSVNTGTALAGAGVIHIRHSSILLKSNARHTIPDDITRSRTVHYFTGTG
jgi:hypothetical protein